MVYLSFDWNLHRPHSMLYRYIDRRIIQPKVWLAQEMYVKYISFMQCVLYDVLQNNGHLLHQ